MRIFAMLLICLWHVNGHFFPLIPHEGNLALGMFGNLMPYITFHVDLFVLTTGYFGIRHSLKGVIKTCILVIFYAILLGGLLFAIEGHHFDWLQLLPFSGSPWWFMRVYLILVLIAPILECYLQSMSKNEMYRLLLIVTFVNVYLGWFRHDALYDQHGYNILNFINVYLIGCWLRMGGRYLDKFKGKAYIPLALFLVCCAIRYKVQPIMVFNWYDYSSPLNQIMATCIFCLFLKVKIPHTLDRFILFFSSSAIAVYLITDYEGCYGWIATSLGYCLSFCNSAMLQFVVILAFVSAMFVICCLIDKIRMMVTSPMETYLSSKIEKYQNIIK